MTSGRTFYDDVGTFHEKFGLPHAEDGGPPGTLNVDEVMFRMGFMLEELQEYARAVSQNDLAKMNDALVDLVYVALGTAHFQRLPFNEAWDEVQRANMAKERADGASDPRSVRGHRADVVKPAGWVPPDIELILQRRFSRLVRDQLHPSEVPAE